MYQHFAPLQLPAGLPSITAMPVILTTDFQRESGLLPYKSTLYTLRATNNRGHSHRRGLNEIDHKHHDRAD